MEYLVLGLFCGALVLGIVLDISMLWALSLGLVLFWSYGRRKGFSWRALAAMTWEGVATVWKILLTFLLIGVMTALWRAAGTVPMIVCSAAELITCLPLCRIASAPPRTAQLSLSEPQEVKTSSPGAQPSAALT